MTIILQAAQALLAKFNQTSDQIMNRSAEAEATRTRAERLRDQVLDFEQDAQDKLNELKGM